MLTNKLNWEGVQGRSLYNNNLYIKAVTKYGSRVITLIIVSFRKLAEEHLKTRGSS